MARRTRYLVTTPHQLLRHLVTTPDQVLRHLVTTPDQVLGAFEEYDLASRSWVRRAEMATPRSHLALACVLNTTLVAVGKGLGLGLGLGFGFGLGFTLAASPFRALPSSCLSL